MLQVNRITVHKSVVYKITQHAELTLYLTEMPFNTFANRADPDQAALARAA